MSDAELRRIRSTGDIPRRPERSHTRMSSRTSQRYSNQGSPSSLSGGIEPISLPLTSFHGGTEPIYEHLGGIPPVAVPVPIQLPPNAAHEYARRSERERNGPLYTRMMAYFGLGRGASRARKSQVSLVWNLSWGLSQVVVISTLLGLSGTRFMSPKQPTLTEWKACDRPLGIWATLWVIRVIIASGLAYWEYVRDRRIYHNRDRAELESGTSAANPTNSGPHNDSLNMPIGDPEPITPQPYSMLYSRLTLLSSLLTLSWFLTAHILEYTSINSCRLVAPHLWWLIFGILCIMYLMVLEVVVLGFIVLIVAPILFLFWNIFLICIGRHPLQNPGMIKPEIGKLSKSVVQEIPLVLYIPPPPETDAEKPSILIPPAAYSYPPKQPPSKPPSRSRFRFLRNISSFNGKRGSSPESTSRDEKPPTGGNEEPETWEGNWEQGEYPFVVLEGNRAACAICLMDFEEPKRKEKAVVDSAPRTDTSPGATSPSTDAGVSLAAGIVEENRQDVLVLEDAGEGAQPLRLLECGHVFHKTCLDPWLIDISGRCPVCQRPVTLPKSPKKTRRRRR